MKQIWKAIREFCDAVRNIVPEPKTFPPNYVPTAKDLSYPR
jgi:hypothetical protein